jgi:diguanylate cyclase (GGDEF)-like protein/PAS domain S-box-containing protein
MSEPNARLFKSLHLYCQVTAIGVMALGCVVLYGWAFNIETLKTVLPGLASMKANTATGLACSGASLWLLLPSKPRRPTDYIARLLALVPTLIGLLTLSEYIFRVNLGIDQLLFHAQAGSHGASAPGRMSPMTATVSLSIGMALTLLNWKTRRGGRPSQVLSVCSGLIAMMVLSGYIYHATALTRLLFYTQMALHTSIAFSLLSTAVFFARPRDGIAGEFTGQGSGSVMARRFLPAVFLFPIFLGWIRLEGQHAGLYGTELGASLFATETVIVFAILVWLNARHMNKEYEQRQTAENGILELNADLEVRVADRTKTLEQQTSVLAEQAALLDLAHDAVAVRDMDNRILFWNRGAEKMYGWTAKEAVGKLSLNLLKTEFSQPLAEIDAQLFRDNHWEGEAVHYTRDGTRLNVACRWALQRDKDGAPVQVLSIIHDITERKCAADALFAEKERAQVTLNSIGDAVICTDISGNISFLNLIAERMTGWSEREAAGRPMAEVFRILDGSTRAAVPNPTELAIGKDQTVHLPEDCILVRRDGFEIPIEDSVAPIHGRDGQPAGAVIVFRDVSASRAMSLEMTHSAQHDFLTGLPNRMLLNEHVRQAIALAPRHNKKLAILFLDLDGFKHINDSLGHPIGDKLLQSIAKGLLTCVRASDTVSRQGGDEFVILLSEIAHAEDPAISARRILDAVGKPHWIDEHDLHITTSIGISVYPDDGVDAETLIKNADLAMYQAKENGHHRFRFFKPAMNERAVARQFIEEGLRRALERQEFTLLYQPKVNLAIGEITGAEALLRWTHPTRGPISPAEFIPVAEDCGLIAPIGNWVLREACKQARAWVEAGLPLTTMAVNVSAMEFRNEHFVDGLFAVLEETGFNPRCLELELTERILMKHADSIETVLKTLKARGVQIAIDDFGTGYSSLSYLQKFPIDALKIDQSFIRQITISPDESFIVAAIINMARNMKLRVVAEGVETQQEMLFLQDHKCDEAQGYYFSRPVPPAEFAKLLIAGVAEKIPVEI